MIAATRDLSNTSLIMLDDSFLKGEGYSVAVNQREIHLDRILNALLDTPRLDMPRELQIRDCQCTGLLALCPPLQIQPTHTPCMPPPVSYGKSTLSYWDSRVGRR